MKLQIRKTYLCWNDSLNKFSIENELEEAENWGNFIELPKDRLQGLISLLNLELESIKMMEKRT